MKSAFERLGMEERLVVSDDELGAAFREAGRRSHPDGGGSETEFAELREAMETLSSPARRLRHWMELRGMNPEPRGTVEAELRDLFAEISGVVQRAEAMIRKRTEAQSALGLAMLEAGVQKCREDIEAALDRVERELSAGCACFAEYERSLDCHPDEMSRTMRNLAFLEKWKGSLRSVFSRLV